MSKKGKLWKESSKLVEGTRIALLTTADDNGLPHATWMNVMTDIEMHEVQSITASTTQKVSNLTVNPFAEWMFSSPSLETIIYLSGPTVIVEAIEAQNFWDKMPDKSKAYYRHYSDPEDPDGFTIIRTHVSKIVYCRPPGYRNTIVHDVPLAK